MSQADNKSFHNKCKVVDCDNKQIHKEEYCNRHKRGDFRCTDCPHGRKFQAKYGTIYEIIRERKLTKCKKHAYRTKDHHYTWNKKVSDKYGKAYFTFDEDYCIFGPIHDMVNDIDFAHATHGLSRVKGSKLFCKLCAEVLNKNGIDTQEILSLKESHEQEMENWSVDEKFIMKLYRGVFDCTDIIKFVDEKYEEYKLININEPIDVVDSSSDSDFDSGDENYDDVDQTSDSSSSDDDDDIIEMRDVED
jgi:hypothetical protein